MRDTDNFCVCYYSSDSHGAEVADHLETNRAKLARKWLGDVLPIWSPKCHVVLHPNAASYRREVGNAPSAGAATIDVQEGRVISRRLDICTERPGWMTGTLEHELTHIVLADRFQSDELPLWADEGMAIQADTAEKQEQHRADMRQALASGTGFRVFELLNLTDYPSDSRWGALYGQSASVVAYLATQAEPRKFAEFLEAAQIDGYDSALRDVYRIEGVAALEAAWLRQASLE